MRVYSTRREGSVYDIFSDLAQTVSSSSELLSRTLAEDPAERAALAVDFDRYVTESASLTRRVTNRLATSLVTPFEADALHALCLTLNDTVVAMGRAVDLTVKLEVGTLPNPLLEVLGNVERGAEIIVQGTWDLRRAEKLGPVYDEMRRLDSYAWTHLHSAIATIWSGDVEPMRAHRLREIIEAIVRVVMAFDSVARSMDLLRVKSS